MRNSISRWAIYLRTAVATFVLTSCAGVPGNNKLESVTILDQVPTGYALKTYKSRMPNYPWPDVAFSADLSTAAMVVHSGEGDRLVSGVRRSAACADIEGAVYLGKTHAIDALCFDGNKQTHIFNFLLGEYGQKDDSAFFYFPAHSPDGEHLAYRTVKDGRVTISVDGRATHWHDDAIAPAYDPTTSVLWRFVRDAKLWYLDSDQSRLHLDFDPEGIRFDNTGRSYVWGTANQSGELNSVLVIDGRETHLSGLIEDGVVLDSIGDYSYVLDNNDVNVLIRNGIQYGPYKLISFRSYSDNGAGFAYIYLDQDLKKSTVVLNNRSFPAPLETDDLAVCDDGAHVAYLTANDGEEDVVINGTNVASYSNSNVSLLDSNPFVFNEDCSMLAYIETGSDYEQVVVRNLSTGAETRSNRHDYIYRPLFRNGSNSVAFGAVDSNKIERIELSTLGGN